MSSLNSTISQSACVNYTVSVIDSVTGEEVKRYPRKRNLILDQGLNQIAVNSWVQCFAVAALGTGTTPTNRRNASITFTRSGTTVTASAAFFVNSDVGTLLKFDTGAEMYITAFTSDTVVTVGVSGALSASQGTVWFVNQTALITETKRSQTYSNNGGANGSTYVGGIYTHKRTFVFSAESGNITYREIGWSWTATVGANLFGRDLFPGAGISLTASQQLQVIVELAVTYSPVTPISYTNVITGGFGGNGNQCLEWIITTSVNTNGTTGNDSVNSARMDPYANRQTCLSTTASALRNGSLASNDIGSQTQSTDVSLAKASYTAGSFRFVETGVLGIANGNRSDWRSIIIGNVNVNNGNLVSTYFRILLDASATKLSTHTLSLTFTMNWGRVLVNV